MRRPEWDDIAGVGWRAGRSLTPCRAACRRPREPGARRSTRGFWEKKEGCVTRYGILLICRAMIGCPAAAGCGEDGQETLQEETDEILHGEDIGAEDLQDAAEIHAAAAQNDAPPVVEANIVLPAEVEEDTGRFLLHERRHLLARKSRSVARSAVRVHPRRSDVCRADLRGALKRELSTCLTSPDKLPSRSMFTHLEGNGNSLA